MDLYCSCAGWNGWNNISGYYTWKKWYLYLQGFQKIEICTINSKKRGQLFILSHHTIQNYSSTQISIFWDTLYMYMVYCNMGICRPQHFTMTVSPLILKYQRSGLPQRGPWQQPGRLKYNSWMLDYNLSPCNVTL